MKIVRDEIIKLMDRVWYNRFENIIQAVERGEVEISEECSDVDDGNFKNNKMINRSSYNCAINSMKKIEEKYNDLGPWSDFEWGVLNGKIAALHWVLYGEWDMSKIFGNQTDSQD